MKLIKYTLKDFDDMCFIVVAYSVVSGLHLIEAYWTTIVKKPYKFNTQPNYKILNVKVESNSQKIVTIINHNKKLK